MQPSSSFQINPTLKASKNNKFKYRLVKFPNLSNSFLMHKKKRLRQENSLEDLTIDFFKYMEVSGSSIIDINSIAQTFHVQKRRIYDIMNVLEGNYYHYFHYFFIFYFII